MIVLLHPSQTHLIIHEENSKEINISNQYSEIGGRLQPNFVNFNLKFPQNMDGFEKPVKKLESVDPVISKYRQAA